MCVYVCVCVCVFERVRVACASRMISSKQFTCLYWKFSKATVSVCWNTHKYQYKSKYPVNFYKVITDIDDWYIQLEGYHPCRNKNEACDIKQTYIDKLSTLNYKSNDEFSRNLYEYKYVIIVDNKIGHLTFYFIIIIFCVPLLPYENSIYSLFRSLLNSYDNDP